MQAGASREGAGCRARSLSRAQVRGVVPADEDGLAAAAVGAEHAEGRGAQQEEPPVRRQAQPPRGEHAQHVPVGEESTSPWRARASAMTRSARAPTSAASRRWATPSVHSVQPGRGRGCPPRCGPRSRRSPTPSGRSSSWPRRRSPRASTSPPRGSAGWSTPRRSATPSRRASSSPSSARPPAAHVRAARVLATPAPLRLTVTDEHHLGAPWFMAHICASGRGQVFRIPFRRRPRLKSPGPPTGDSPGSPTGMRSLRLRSHPIPSSGGSPLRQSRFFILTGRRARQPHPDGPCPGTRLEARQHRRHPAADHLHAARPGQDGGRNQRPPRPHRLPTEVPASASRSSTAPRLVSPWRPALHGEEGALAGSISAEVREAVSLRQVCARAAVQKFRSPCSACGIPWKESHGARWPE